MVRLFLFLTFLLSMFFALFNPSESGLIKVVPLSHESAGVFLLIEGGQYTLNFSAARAACLSLNVTMATRAQMEEAVHHGLETCKFGWIAEKTGVIPRLYSDKNCGKGKTGVVTWYASEDTKFGVFCFNTSAAYLDKKQKTTTVSLHSSTSSTPVTALTPTSTPTAPLIRSTIKSPSSTKMPITSKSPEQTLSTSASAPLVGTSLSSRISSLVFPSHHTTASPHHLITSKPSVINMAVTTSAQMFSSDLLQTSVSSAKPPLKAIATALTLLGIVVLLLMAAGAAWRYQLKTSCWCQTQQDDLETEMWKQTYSETGLHDEHGPEEDHDEEDLDINSSCDTTPCVNPHISANK
ncbi:lymphatic vessel endothelial hyaluronic receptor 1b isoform X2 [Melanotaenia boesemani]|uniref:lymphatic vessel endothelial hyaluronic receptor 1b isoform X2 n=1 Tax=Melanotaenia boesemani TaxID=1250792 RepID=UPI001C042AF8|nr:lymphatic vessel endothelial hyaluronic receptor 1b isoform X2 [Melanotaenia boesemani]